MATTIEIADRAALVAHVHDALARYDLDIRDEHVRVDWYATAAAGTGRPDWQRTYIVTVDGYGVFGFINAHPGPFIGP